MATLTATGQEKVQKGFAPLMPGFSYVEFNDLTEVGRAMTPKTAAVMLEPIQAEGGVYVADRGYLQGLRELCRERDVLLIFDEVQTGMGRTGTLFCYEQFGMQPDIMTLAKGLGAVCRSGPVSPQTLWHGRFLPGLTRRRSAVILWPAPQASPCYGCSCMERSSRRADGPVKV